VRLHKIIVVNTTVNANNVSSAFKCMVELCDTFAEQEPVCGIGLSSCTIVMNLSFYCDDFNSGFKI